MTDSRLQTIIDVFGLRDGHFADVPFIAADNRSSLPEGWLPHFQRLVEDLVRLGWDRRVLQIKEKFGTMRVYISQRELPLVDLTIEARETSASICEECGAVGTLLAQSGWYATLCDLCRLRLRGEAAAP